LIRHLLPQKKCPGGVLPSSATGRRRKVQRKLRSKLRVRLRDFLPENCSRREKKKGSGCSAFFSRGGNQKRSRVRETSVISRVSAKRTSSPIAMYDDSYSRGKGLVGRTRLKEGTYLSSLKKGFIIRVVVVALRKTNNFSNKEGI